MALEQRSASAYDLLKALWPNLPSTEQRLLELFLTPPPPGRAKLTCMRGAAQMNPTCSRMCKYGKQCHPSDTPMYFGCAGNETRPDESW